MSWTQPQCEVCWIDEQGTWVPVSDGAERLEAVRLPMTVASEFRQVEQCCTCGAPTIAGIYIRRDPKTVSFPRADEVSQEIKPNP